jgi:hypothetical protein
VSRRFFNEVRGAMTATSDRYDTQRALDLARKPDHTLATRTQAPSAKRQAPSAKRQAPSDSSSRSIPPAEKPSEKFPENIH